MHLSANVCLPIMAVSALSVTACTSGGGSGSPDAATSDGGPDTPPGGGITGSTVDGPIAFGTAFARLNPTSQGSLQIDLFNQAVTCGWQQIPCNAEFRRLTIALYPNPPSTTPIGVGTYNNSSGDPSFGFEAYLMQVPMVSGSWLCGGNTTNDLILDSPSTITFTTVTPTLVEGTASLTMRERQAPANTHTLSGSFSATSCN